MTIYDKNHTDVFKALSDETRLKIVHILACESMNANALLECFSISQPTLSYHMKILTGCGLVRARREASSMIYCVDAGKLTAIKALTETLLSGAEVQASVAE